MSDILNDKKIRITGGPLARDIRVFIDDEDISTRISGLTIRWEAAGLVSATVDFLAAEVDVSANLAGES